MQTWVFGALIALSLLGLDAAYGAGSDPQFITDVFSHSYGYRQQVDLAGVWEFHRDKENKGAELGWQTGKDRFDQTLKIPGVPQAQGLGEPTQSMKYHLDEPYWVRRKFTMPRVGEGKRVWLRVGGTLPAADIYINGSRVGYTQSSRTQQRVDVTDFVRPSSGNLIAVKVCDWPKVKLEGIWEMAELQRVWTGIYRPISLEITDPVSFKDIYTRPNLASKSVKVNLELTSANSDPLEARLEVRDGSRLLGASEVPVPAGETEIVSTVELSDFTPWSPNHPKLYDLTVSLHPAGSSANVDKVGLRFGMREIKSIGTKFYLNGNPIYLRAFGDDQMYCHTICPPVGKDAYLPMLKRARQFGLNAAKSCEEIFNQDYIEAADEAGILIIQEMPFGLSGEVRVNQHQLDKPWRDYYTRELDGLLRESRNNASVIAYSMCSEVPLDDGTQEAFDLFARDLPSRTKELAPHALVIDNTGWNGGQIRRKGVRVTDFYAIVNPLWCKEALNEVPVTADGKHPIMMHEYNWWSCYPDPRTRSSYDNTPLPPWWLDVLEKSAKDNRQADLVPTYVKNSAWLQALCRKDGMEYARRCPNVEGFILWLITDFGQYTEGLFDDFWRPKANASAADFLQSTADTVVLLTKEGNRCLTTGASHSIPLSVSHYGEEPLRDCTLKWRVSGGRSGEIRIASLDPGQVSEVGSAIIDLTSSSSARRLDLDVELFSGGTRINSNRWSFWSMPDVADPLAGALIRSGAAQKPIPQGCPLVIADRADQPLVDYLNAGGRVLLLSQGLVIEEPENIYQGYTTFRTIPWNGGPGNLGTVISDHPALRSFPHGEACDFQFTWLISKAHPMNFGPLRETGITPIIRDIDWYRTNKNLAYIMEFKVGKGSVLAASLRLLPNLKDRLEARYLLKCLVDYVKGPAFAPAAAVPQGDFTKLFSPAPAKDGK